ncbi:flagellar hook-length control protein FliK [Cupriavidus sp. WKF15]|uniref:flagellar hook-length control protein FliK n=1 Tax=Cupriavidus sp. WKF15 TaxID=3032282 RepID=UPI0023E1D8AB|nr:flagellar hook-length control protein FliK [Cupriavidus sp. WKF15]WER49359.1 flagellar hook-length control protein FliK [Cupriavidus sp. WKF15]
MIDISQLVSNATAQAKPASRMAADAGDNAFGAALSRAKDSARPEPRQDSGSNAQPASDSPAQEGKSGSTTDAQDAARAAAGKPVQPGRRKDQDGKDHKDDGSAQAADAGAAAAALAALLPATPLPAASANSAAGAAGVADSAAVGAAGASGLALPQAPAIASADAASAALAEVTPDTAGKQVIQATVKDATAASAAAPTAADTLANILSQRAALPGASAQPAPADSSQTATTSGTALNAMPGARQGHAGQFADGQSQAGTGQSRHAALSQADGTAQGGKPAATPFTPVQVTAGTGDAATVTQNDGAAPAIAAALANQTPSAAPAAAAAAARPVVAPPLNDAQWPQALGQQMIRLTTQGSQSAELQLNPPDLGPLKVVLNVVNDQAQAQFVSPHQAVRAAVEAALPHLRTALSESGIQLGQASVGADSFAGQAGNGQQQQAGNGRGHPGFGADLAKADSRPAPTSAPARPARMLAQGEVDTFA